MIAVADSGPLIHLARIGKLELLWSLYGTVFVPEPVYREVVITGKGRAGSAEVARVVHEPAMATGPRFAALRLELSQLGAGEVSAIACALDHQADLVLIDDLAARRAAQSRGLAVKGTLGVLLDAKAKGHIQRVADVAGDLLRTGAWLDPAVVREALRLAGELS